MAMNWTIDFGNILTIFTILGGLVQLYYNDRAKLTRFESIQTETFKRLSDVEKKLNGLSEILAKLAAQDERLTSHGERLRRLEDRADK